MSKNEDTRMILHRVVFYDLLSTPDIDSQKDTYGKIHEAHLSIPLIPGLETVWAPNGYGKTFAMQILERIWKPSKYSLDDWTIRGGVHWLSDFLRECQAMVLDISVSKKSDSIRQLRTHDVVSDPEMEWIPEGVQRMVPFSLMMARIVRVKGSEIEEVSDLWIRPNWTGFLTHDIEVEVSVLNHFSQVSMIDKKMFNQLEVDEELGDFIYSKWGKSPGTYQNNSELESQDYFNPIIPLTYKYNGELFDDDNFSSEPWSHKYSTRERRPPNPYFLLPSSISEHPNNFNKVNSMQPQFNEDIEELLDILRCTKIDYVEIPKESLQFFEDTEKATDNVVKIIKNIDASDAVKIEDNINDVLIMKGETDPWSRKVSLIDSEPLQKIRAGKRIWGPKFGHFEQINLDLEGLNKQLPKNQQLDLQTSYSIPRSFVFKEGKMQIFATVPGSSSHLSKAREKSQKHLKELSGLNTHYLDLVRKASYNLTSNLERLEKTDKETKIVYELRQERERLLEHLHLYQVAAADPSTKEAEMKKDIEDKQKELQNLLAKNQKNLDKVQRNLNVYDIHTEISKKQFNLIQEILAFTTLAESFVLEEYNLLSMLKPYPTFPVALGHSVAFARKNIALLYLTKQIEDLSEIESSWYGVDKGENNLLEVYDIKGIYRSKSMPEAYRIEFMKMKRKVNEQININFEVDNLYRKTRLRKDVLSFGQKSTILTELYLGTFEALSQSTDDDEELDSDNRYCLIIDEPEVGRSEYSLDLLIKRLKSSKNIHDNEMQNSVVVLSHRNKLLKQVSGKYHLLQPVDIGYQTEEE